MGDMGLVTNAGGSCPTPQLAWLLVGNLAGPFLWYVELGAAMNCISLQSLSRERLLHPAAAAVQLLVDVSMALLAAVGGHFRWATVLLAVRSTTALRLNTTRHGCCCGMFCLCAQHYIAMPIMLCLLEPCLVRRLCCCVKSHCPKFGLLAVRTSHVLLCLQSLS